MIALAPAQWVAHHAERTPLAPAIDAGAVRLSYRGLAQRIAALAAALARRGLRQGKMALVLLPSGPAAAIATLAIQASGACAVEVNRDSAPGAIERALKDAEPEQVFVWGRDLRRWRELAAPSVRQLWVLEPDAETAQALSGNAGWLPIGADGAVEEEGALECAEPDPDGPALVLYTSGSTGEPRGVVQTFRNLFANARSIVEYLGLGPSDRAMNVLPLSYCYGKSILHTHLMVGGSVFLEDRFAFPRRVLELIGSEGCTGFAGIPLTFEILRRQIDPRAVAMPALRYLTQAGGAMSPETTRWAREAFRPARLFVMYGQTEATARLAYLPPERGEEKLGSIGVPIPGVELRVVDEAGTECPEGETGHLIARGQNIAAGYLGAPAETAQSFRGGWLWTGDLAYRDRDGFFFVVGRAKEILKIAGYRVSPQQIEAVLTRHPLVEDAGVTGVHDALGGEAAAAFVVVRGSAQLTKNELRRFCRGSLPSYMVPKHLCFVGRLPRSSAGKLLRRELSALLELEEERQ